MMYYEKSWLYNHSDIYSQKYASVQKKPKKINNSIAQR